MKEFQSKFNGVIAALVTCMDENQNVNYEAIEDHIEFLIKAGIRVFSCLGSTGEFASLTDYERQQVIKTVVKAVGNDGLVVPGTSSTCLNDCITAARQAESAGAHGALMLAPFYFKVSQDELWSFFKKFDESIGVPFVIYNNPVNTKVDFSLDLIEQFLSFRNFAGLKDSSSDMARFYEVIQRFGKRMSIIGAAGPIFVFQALAGADGIMPVVPNFAPRLSIEMFDAASKGNVQDALHLFGKIFEYRKLMAPRMQEGYAPYVSYAKAALELIGIPAGPPRLPLHPLNREEKDAVAKVLEESMGITLTH